jgi:serine O-acetyltransferase
VSQEISRTRSQRAGQPLWNLADVVTQLRQNREVAHNIRQGGRLRDLPSRDEIRVVLDGLFSTLFPTHYGRPDLTEEAIDYFVGSTLHSTLNLLHEQVRRELSFSVDPGRRDEDALNTRSESITRDFAARLPDIRALLAGDLQAAYEGDPAASSLSEILLAYPGMTAVIEHRLAHALYTLGAPLLARLISNHAHALTGIDIHPGAEIGGSFFIDHGTGVVIGQTAVIGRHVRLYQAVTLGAKRFPLDDQGAAIKGIARHPIVEDDVIIYAGATVLGRVTIGRGSTIGGNVWLTENVPPRSLVTQARVRSDGQESAQA